MNRTASICLFGALGLALALGACSGIGEQLGLSKKSPDEFRVVSHEPLALPPDFQLRPPEPGAPRPQEGTAQQQAQIAVFRAVPSSAPAPGTDPNADLTPGEQALLLSAGADRTEPNIRQLINQETSEINEADETFITKLIFWYEPEPPGVIVDPDAEARRLRENAALGREATAGQTPIIERKAKGIFEDIF
jgi:hypothetical protein